MNQHNSYTIKTLENHAFNLLNEILDDSESPYGGGDVGASAYDTAWVAMVRYPDDHPAFAESLKALLSMQNPDGSFGVAFPHSVVPSLAAALCLTTMADTHKAADASRERVLAYLREVLPRWDPQAFEAIAIELVAPHLLQALESTGVSLDFPARDALIQMVNKKLALLDPELLYRGSTSMVYSLEAMGSRLDLNRCGKMQHANGSFGGSMAATASTLIYGDWNKSVYNNLAFWVNRGIDGVKGVVPVVGPINIFEMNWLLKNLLLCGTELHRDIDPSTRARVEAVHQANWTSTGVCSGPSSWPSDGDNTSVHLKVRHALGLSVDFSVVLSYLKPTHFECFPGERDISITCNAHALDACNNGEQANTPEMLAVRHLVASYILQEQCVDGYWTSKWHHSSLYATYCVVPALADSSHEYASAAVVRAVAWVLEARKGAGWGLIKGITAEETAYAAFTVLAGLSFLEPKLRSAAEVALASARHYLLEHLEQKPLASLWVSKEPYTPRRVVRGTVISALIALTRHFDEAC